MKYLNNISVSGMGTGKCLVILRNRLSGKYRPPQTVCFDEDNDDDLASPYVSFWCSKDVSGGQSKIVLRRLQQEWFSPTDIDYC